VGWTCCFLGARCSHQVTPTGLAAVELKDEREEEEEFERACNFGFTEAETEELLCQGVKPWDDDAADVLDFLDGGYY
jgi:hypothetical protein